MKVKSIIAVLLLIVALPMTIACSSKDNEDENAPFNVNDAVGTWMCIQSTDTYQGSTQEGLLVGAEVTIRNNGTYSSTASSFGYNGTYTTNGNKITAKSSTGFTFVVTVSVNGSTMTWTGTASSGVNFRYVFQKET